MTFEDFKDALRNDSVDLAEKMYNYGYTCGLENIINYDNIRAAFYNFNFSEEEEFIYLQRIIKGFKDGKYSK